MSTRSLWLGGRTTPWPPGRLKDHVEVVNGFPFDSSKFNATNGFPVIRIRDLAVGYTDTRFDGPVPDDVVVRRGDLLIGMDGDFNMVLWPGDDAALNQRLCMLRPRSSIYQKFLSYVITQPLMAINAITYFTTVKHLSSTDLLEERIPLPPLLTQRAVADFLDRETARIDVLITAKRRMIELFEERRFSLASCQVVPADAPKARLGYFAQIQTGLTVDASRSRDRDAVERPYIRVANVQAGWLDLDEVTTVTVPRLVADRTTLRPGDVLMTEGGDLDKLGRGTVWEGQIPNCLHQNHVFAVRPRLSQLDPYYLSLVTRTSHARSYFEKTGVKTTNLASTNSGKILDLPVPVLPIEQQRELVRAHSNQDARSIAASSALNRQIQLLQERRQALITAAVTGELLVGSPVA